MNGIQREMICSNKRISKVTKMSSDQKSEYVDVSSELRSLITGEREEVLTQLDQDLYDANAEKQRPNIGTGAWTDTVDDYFLKDYESEIEVDPEGLHVVMDAEYITDFPDVERHLSLEHRVDIYDRDGAQTFDSGVNLGLVGDQAYVVTWDIDSNFEEETGTKIATFAPSGLSVEESLEKGVPPVSLQDPRFMGSRNRNNSTISEPQALVYIAEMAKRAMNEGGITEQDLIQEKFEGEGFQTENKYWQKANLFESDMHPGERPTTASDLKLLKDQFNR